MNVILFVDDICFGCLNCKNICFEMVLIRVKVVVWIVIELFVR